MTFSFHAYVRAPSGWRILRNDDELWLDQKSTGRCYMIRCPMRGEFELFFTDGVCNREPQFVCRTDSLYSILQKVGVLSPQPSQCRRVREALKEPCPQLTYRKTRS